MTQIKYDVVVIGAGPGGYVAAIRAAQNGLKVACIEKNATMGGTCLNVGCIPSKALLQSSEVFDLMSKHSAEYGVQAQNTGYDFLKMQQRKEGIVNSLVTGVAGLLKRNKVDVITGCAVFVDPHHVEVKFDKTITSIEAQYFIIATGSTSVELPFLPFDETSIVSSTGALAFEEVPKKLLVIGAGAIGVELASVYKRLGAEVLVIEMLDAICPTMDSAVSKTLQQILKKQGLDFYLKAKVLSAKKNSSGVELTVLMDGQEQLVQGERILVCIGRKPNTAHLGLDAIQVTRDKRGFIKVDHFLRTSQQHIYAIGDVTEGPMLAHKASEEGMVAADIIAGSYTPIHYMAIPNVIYTTPEVASVGLTESEAKDAGFNLMVGISQFKGNARARCVGDTEGFVKVVGDQLTGRLLGVHIIGHSASEMIGEGVIALIKHATVADIAYASHAHPTLTEAVKEACLAALGRTLHG